MSANWYSTGSSTVMRGIERGGLAAASRPGNQHQPVRTLQNAQPIVQIAAGDSKRLEIQCHRVTVENPHDDAFAMHRRQGRDTQIDRDAAHRHLDASVLRQLPLGDIEPRQDLDARDNGGAIAVRRRFDFAQRSVDRDADPEAAVARLQMDVRSAGLDRGFDDAVDHADDRGFAGHVLQPLDVELDRLVTVAIVRRAGLGRLAMRVEPFDCRIQFGLHGNPRLDRTARGQPHGVHRIGVERIGHGQHQPVVGLGQRQDSGFLQESQADLAIQQRQGREVALADQRHAGLTGQRFRQVTLRNQAELGQHPGQTLAIARSDPTGAFQRPFVQLAGFHQRLAQRQLDGFTVCGERRFRQPLLLAAANSVLGTPIGYYNTTLDY